MLDDRIGAYVQERRGEAIELLRELVSIDSTFIDQGVRGNEGAAQTWLEEKLSSWGFETVLFEPDNARLAPLPDYNAGHDYAGRPNLAGVMKGTGGGRSLILNGHVDTVPLDDLSKWSHPPLGGEIANGKLYGRGACDMKAGLVAMILAARYVKEMGLVRRGDVFIESVVDEEGGGNGTLACVEKGYTADAAIVTEPTGLKILRASRGVFLLKVTVAGKASHACYKWKGVNAIEKAMVISNALSELERRWLATRKNPFLPSPTITLGEITGGISAATVPGTCVMKFDVKYLPSELNESGECVPVEADSIQKEVENAIATACMGDAWLSEHRPETEWYLSVMPHEIGEKALILETIAQVCDEQLGGHVVSGLPSGADARHLQNNGGIPTILFGPGDMGCAHSIDEHVDVDEYIQSIIILAKTIARWTA